MNATNFTLFYDGLCPLCSREIAHYRHKAAHDPSVAFVDICDPSFDAQAYGLDPQRVHQVMHVKVGDEIHTGLDAFLAIWQRIPGHTWLHRLARLPGAYPLLELGYHLFARIRPYLPRKKPTACSTGTCR